WRDAARGSVLAAVGLAVAWAVHLIDWGLVPRREYLDLAVLAGGLTAGLGGALRIAGKGARRRWVVDGLLSGLMVLLRICVLGGGRSSASTVFGSCVHTVGCPGSVWDMRPRRCCATYSAIATPLRDAPRPRARRSATTRTGTSPA